MSQEPIKLSISAVTKKVELSSNIMQGINHAPTAEEWVLMTGNDDNLKNAIVKQGHRRPNEIRKVDFKWGGEKHMFPNPNQFHMKIVSIGEVAYELVPQTQSLVAGQNPSTTDVLDVIVQCSMEATNSLRTSYSEDFGLSNTLSVEVSGKFGVADVKIGDSLTMSHSFGKEIETSKNVTLGSSASLTLHIPPRHKGFVENVYSQGTASADVVYEVSMTGSIIAYYDHPEHGNNLVVYDINNLLQTLGMPTTKRLTQKVVSQDSSGLTVTPRYEALSADFK